MRKKAFTLIELLVVISIIALLLSIIMPSLRKAKNIAQRLTCKANARSLAFALRLYADQNDGEVFEYLTSLYITQLAVFVDNIDKIRYCPSTKIDYSGRGSATRTWCWPVGVPPPGECGSYAFNGWLYSYREPLSQWGWIGIPEITEYAWLHFFAVKNSGIVPVFVDSNWVDAWPKHTDTAPPESPTVNLSTGGFGTDNPVNEHMGRLIINRHWGYTSVSFVDGHADTYELKELWQFKWSRKFISQGGNMTRPGGKPIYHP